ncbi:MAG: sensor histidine kinase [Chloroflexota bacterium]
MQTTEIKSKPGFNWQRFWRLQSKLIVPYVLLTLILASLGIFIVTRLVAEGVRERFENQMRDASQVAADGMRRRERTHLEALRALANTLGVSDAVLAGDAAALDALLKPLVLNTKPDLVAVIDASGMELVAWGRDLQSGQYVTSTGNDFSSLDVVQKALSGQADEQGDKYTGLVETAYGQAFVTTVAVRNADNQPVGVMMIGTLLDTLVAELKQQSYASIVLLDLSPTLLCTTLPQFDEVASPLEALAAQSDPQNAQPADVELYGSPYQVMYVPWQLRSEKVGWLGVVFSSNFLVSSYTTNSLLFSVVFTAGTIGIILVGYFISQHIARPILRLRSMSQAVAAGDLTQQIRLERADEIGDLADAFDVMTAHLRERTAEAERLYKEAVQRNQELAEINAKLQAAQLQLIQSEKLAAVGQLTAGIVHDVKNPLAVIKGLAELLEEDLSDPDETRKELRVIRDSAERASRIVGDLLKFARQSSSEMQTHDIRETVAASLRLTDYLLRQAKIKLASEIPDEPILVDYDPQQLEQVLINMIHNAIQAMPDRGSLSVCLGRQGDQATIRIQDTGSGIAPENLKRIFDPFFTTKPEGQGTGLGLSMSYGIIANHHGRIDVQSELGKGTTFTIFLPAVHIEKIGPEQVIYG